MNSKQKKAVAVVEINPSRGDIDPAVEEAVDFINNHVGGGLLKMAMDVGNYVLERFFGGKIEEAMSRNPHKEHSYRKLQNHPGLKIHHKALNDMVRIFIQEKSLLNKISEENIKLLSYSHRIELLAAPEDIKIELAEKCIEEHLTIKQMRKEIPKPNTQPHPGNKNIGDPFIRSIITKNSNKKLSIKYLKGKRADSLKKIQKKIDDYLEDIENTKTQLNDILKKLKPIYQEKVKSEKNPPQMTV